MKIKVGDEIEYVSKTTVHGVKTDQVQTRKGTVTQITDRFIAVKGQRYPDTLLIHDIKTGKAKIVKAVSKDGSEEEGNDLYHRRTRYSDYDWPFVVERARGILQADQNISVYKAAEEISKDIKVPRATIYNHLKAAGLLEEFPTERNEIRPDTADQNINSGGGDTLNDQDNKGEVLMDAGTVLADMKVRWIQEVLDAALSSPDQITIINGILRLEGAA